MKLCGQVSLADEPLEPGRYQVRWNGRDARDTEVPTGVYVARVEAGAYSGVIRLLRLR